MAERAQIVAKVTGTNTNAANVGPSTADSPPLTWNNIAGSLPCVTIRRVSAAIPPARSANGGTLVTDQNYSYPVIMSTGCWSYATSGSFWWVASTNRLCAASTVTTHRLAPGVELVSAGGNPVVTGTVATGLVLTWNSPPWAATGDTAEGGWSGEVSMEDSRVSKPRYVTVRYPRANFAPPGQECDYQVPVNGATTDVSATYISLPGTPGEVKTASAGATGPYTLSCVVPFARADFDRKTSTMDGLRRTDPTVSYVQVPVGAGSQNLKEWQVTVANTANVPGVATVTDNTLDQPNMPVYQIVAPAGSSISWTATNGTTTQSGTSSGTANAPAGYRFVTAVTTSPLLAAPNRRMSETFRTPFTVVYKYRVTPEAPIGASRTNSASSVMSYPDYPELAPVSGNHAAHTVIFGTPFGRGWLVKGAVWPNVTSGSNISMTIPGAGSTRGQWEVGVRNTGNVFGVPTITDTTLGNANLPVVRISGYTQTPSVNNQGQTVHSTVEVTNAGSVSYTLDNGVTGTSLLPYNAPAGRRIVSATVTGPSIMGPNGEASFTDWAGFTARFEYNVLPTSSPGTYTNTASGTMTYPGYNLPTVNVGPSTATVRLVAPQPTITATWNGRPTIPGGAHGRDPVE